eukprot:Skav211436  [mRNA]  locus=scaffold1591:136274:137476:- [translate_table: standard]
MNEGTFSGVGFALPIDTVTKNVGAMIEEGYVSRPSIGVELAPDAMSESLGMPGAMVMKAGRATETAAGAMTGLTKR